MEIFRQGPSNGASYAGRVGKNRDSRLDRRLYAAVRSTIATVDRVVYRTGRHATVNFIYHSQHGRPRRREETRTEFICTQR